MNVLMNIIHEMIDTTYNHFIKNIGGIDIAMGFLISANIKKILLRFTKLNTMHI